MHSAWARTSSAKQSHRSVTSYVEIDITPLESLLKSSVKEAAPSANAADTSAVPRGKARDAPDLYEAFKIVGDSMILKAFFFSKFNRKICCAGQKEIF